MRHASSQKSSFKKSFSHHNNMPAFTKFAVAGGTGNVGRSISLALLEQGFHATILTRDNSQTEELSKAGAKIVAVDYSSEENLVEALQDVEVVINALATQTLAGNAQTMLAQAAKKAGSKLFVPNDFGVDYKQVQQHPSIDLHAFVQGKPAFEKTLEDLSLDRLQFFNGVYTSFVPIIFRADKQAKTAIVDGDGKAKFAATSEREVGQFIAHTFKTFKEEELRNKTVRIASGIQTANELLERAGYKVIHASLPEAEAKAKDLSLGEESFIWWLRTAIAQVAMDFSSTNDSARTGYKPTDDVAAFL
jgi:uncharacterized protein YbjT (DUF2867 family)